MKNQSMREIGCLVAVISVIMEGSLFGWKACLVSVVTLLAAYFWLGEWGDTKKEDDQK